MHRKQCSSTVGQLAAVEADSAEHMCDVIFHAITRMCNGSQTDVSCPQADNNARLLLLMNMHWSASELLQYMNAETVIV